MISLQSRLTDQVDELTDLKQFFADHEFTLGGNWEYDHGSFDRALDEEHKVWLRVPFQVVSGTIDGSVEDSETTVRMGAPYVLKHLYQEGNDQEARAMTYRGLIDQFQTPLDRDAEVEKPWVDKANQVMREIEQQYMQ